MLVKVMKFGYWATKWNFVEFWKNLLIYLMLFLGNENA